jgi:ABC-type antimicrobial peptide transport system permease subunit
VTFAGFSDQLKENFGVLNVHMQNGESKYPDAQKRAEEIISTYLEQYSIDSVEYAVIYDGEIVIQGSSSAYKIESIIDFKEFVRLNIGSISAATSMITQIFAIISLIIISLVLSMTISSIITKRRCELGIMKSSGYTTKQLARQLAISFMPMTAIGAVIGCALGASTVGPVISAAFAGQGAYGMTFATNPLTIALAGLIIIVVTYFVANFFAMRIKKISVYELISE